MSPPLNGFDVYHGNGMPAFPWRDMVRKYGITLGCCKVSQGTSFVDPAWQANRFEMHRAGLRYVGLYHWLSPNVPLDLQLRNFSRIGTLEPGEFVMLDIEDKGGLTLGFILEALAMWEAAYPGRLIRYQGKYFAASDTIAYAGYPWWLAYYGPSTIPATFLPVALWQWGGATLGVEHFDSNQIINLGAIERLAGYMDHGQYKPEELEMLEGFVKDDAVGDVWCRGVDEKGQWSVRITAGDNPLGIAWELYNVAVQPVPIDSLKKYLRTPDFPVTVIPPVATSPIPTPIDYAFLANMVADVLSARMAA